MKKNIAIVIRTEAWETKRGTAIKAVARDEKGRLLSATNQTATVLPLVVGKR